MSPQDPNRPDEATDAPKDPTEGTSAPVTPEAGDAVSPEAASSETAGSETAGSETAAAETAAAESAAAEAAPTETPAPDAATPEATATETPTPEAATPEAPATETAAPEAPATETPAPDATSSETATPEAGATDSAPQATADAEDPTSPSSDDDDDDDSDDDSSEEVDPRPVAERAQELLARARDLVEQTPKQVHAAWPKLRKSFRRISDGVADDVTQAWTELSTRLDDLRGQHQKQRRNDNLARLSGLANQLEKMHEVEDIQEINLRKAERCLREAQLALKGPGPLPEGSDWGALSKRFEASIEALTPKVKQLGQEEEWKRWANVPLQEELCTKMDALQESNDMPYVARQVRELSNEWRKVASAPKEKAEELWQRFRSSREKVRERLGDYFDKQKVVRKENLKKKEALCEQVEALKESNDWRGTAEEIKFIQAQWKKTGPVPRKQSEPIWQRFRSACDHFFDRRKAHYDEIQHKREANLKTKEGLCERAEAVKDSTDWVRTTERLKALQLEWKEVGPVPRKYSEVIWQRFRTACDYFFDRRSRRNELHLDGNVEQKEAALEALLALLPPKPKKKKKKKTDTPKAKAAPKTEETPATEAPVEPPKADEAPADEPKVDDAKVEETPATEAPVEPLKADEAKVEETPVTDAPVEPLKADEAKVEETPVTDAPVEAAKADEAPADEPKAEETPAEEAKADEAPAEEAKADDASADDAPAEPAQAAEVTEAPEEPVVTEPTVPENLVESVNELLDTYRKAGEIPKSREGGLQRRYLEVANHLITAYGEGLSGTDLDPATLHKKREQLAERVEKAARQVEKARAEEDESKPSLMDLANQLQEALAANTIRKGAPPVDDPWHSRSERVEGAKRAWSGLPGEAEAEVAQRFDAAVKGFEALEPKR